MHLKKKTVRAKSYSMLAFYGNSKASIVMKYEQNIHFLGCAHVFICNKVLFKLRLRHIRHGYFTSSRIPLLIIIQLTYISPWSPLQLIFPSSSHFYSSCICGKRGVVQHSELLIYNNMFPQKYSKAFMLAGNDVCPNDAYFRYGNVTFFS